jgi:hypothetical protein
MTYLQVKGKILRLGPDLAVTRANWPDENRPDGRGAVFGRASDVTITVVQVVGYGRHADVRPVQGFAFHQPIGKWRGPQFSGDSPQSC